MSDKQTEGWVKVIRSSKSKAVARAAKSPIRWLMISVTMPSPQDLERGMEIASTFEDRHGGKPPMYFARYTEDNTIRITVLTHQDSKTLKSHFKKLGTYKIKVEDRGGGSWEHCHMFQVAKHVFSKPPSGILDVVHWLHSMCNYTYLQEATNNAIQTASVLSYLVKRPNEVPACEPANESQKG